MTLQKQALDALGEVILASASPRRADLLVAAGVTLGEVRPADIDETPLEGESADDLVERLAVQKAAAVAAQTTAGVVLGGDTVVVLAGEVLGKPADREQAASMLRSLAGRQHLVLSGVALCQAPAGPTVSGVACSVVGFTELDDSMLNAYLDGGEWEGKAGGYAIQGDAAAFARLLDGDRDTVVGLPMALVADLAQRLIAARGSV